MYQHLYHGELPISYITALQSPTESVTYLFDIFISACSHDDYGCTPLLSELVNMFSFSLSHCRLCLCPTYSLYHSLLLLMLLLLLLLLLLFMLFVFALLSTRQYGNTVCFHSTTSTAFAFARFSILIMIGWVQNPTCFEGIVCSLATQYFEVRTDHVLCL
jgi:hypothetical protein